MTSSLDDLEERDLERRVNALEHEVRRLRSRLTRAHDDADAACVRDVSGRSGSDDTRLEHGELLERFEARVERLAARSQAQRSEAHQSITAPAVELNRVAALLAREPS